MRGLLSLSKLYTLLLFLFPALIIVSWVNVFSGNANLQLPNYLLTHVLPAVVSSYLIALLAAAYMKKQYAMNFKRVFFTLTALTGALFLYSYIASIFGFESQFITAHIPSVISYDKQQVLGISTQDPDPRETASKFYSFEMIVTMIVLVVAYSVAVVLFKKKRKRNAKVVKDSGKKKAVHVKGRNKVKKGKN